MTTDPAIGPTGEVAPCSQGHPRFAWELSGGFVNDCLGCEPVTTAFQDYLVSLAWEIAAERAGEGGEAA